jgi:hypothetical protein
MSLTTKPGTPLYTFSSKRKEGGNRQLKSELFETHEYVCSKYRQTCQNKGFRLQLQFWGEFNGLSGLREIKIMGYFLWILWILVRGVL